MQRRSFPVPEAAAGTKLGIFLRQQGVSAGTIKAVKFRGDGFFADEMPVHTDYRLRGGETVWFSLPPEKDTSVQPEPVPVVIAYEDEDLMLVDKPAGLAVHPTLNYPSGTLANGWVYLMQQRGTPCVFRPVNRLDKNTSGLVLCAKSGFAAAALAGGAEKRYLALVQGGGLPFSGEINAPIARRGDSIIGRCVDEAGKPSRTLFQTLAQDDSCALVLCTLLTGRTHQIRVHFSHIGHPLLGDTLYGGSTEELGYHALHCAAMRVMQPTQKNKITVCSPLPEEFREICERHFGLDGMQWNEAFYFSDFSEAGK